MGFFKSKKGSIISDYFILLEDVASFSKGNLYELALYEDHLELTSRQKKKLLLNYDQITDVFYGSKTELITKSKSVIGRAVAGGLLFGSTGAIIGALSGTEDKKKKKFHFYFIISYESLDGKNCLLQFEDIRVYKGKKISLKLAELAGIQDQTPKSTASTIQL